MAIAVDAVCGMEVDAATYWFCGKGCLLEFKDDPPKYLAEDYQPSM